MTVRGDRGRSALLATRSSSPRRLNSDRSGRAYEAAKKHSCPYGGRRNQEGNLSSTRISGDLHVHQPRLGFCALLVVLAGLLWTPARAENPAASLAAPADYDPAIPTLESLLGFVPGTRPALPEQIERCFRK